MPGPRPAAALAVLAAGLVVLAAPAAADPPPIRALLVIGGCCHDYGKQKDLLTQGISARANVSWAISYDPDRGTKHLNPVYEKADWAKGFDVVVHDECTADVKDRAVVERILDPHRRGVPGVVLHCGMHSYRTEGYPDKTTPWFEFTGLATTRHDAQAPIDVSIVDKDNPITKGMADWKTVNEELYNNFTGKLLDTAKPLARGKQTVKGKDKKERTDEFVVAWTNTYHEAKVFATTLGHNNDTVADARYLDLVARGLLWSVGKLDPAHLTPAKSVMLDGN
jgi:type 1 glutamine amidotransferase